MNRVELIGRLTKDPELNEGKATTCTFVIAVRRKENDTDFIRCVAFGKTADTIKKYVGKGRQVAVEGSIRTGSYEKSDGTKVYTTDVFVDRIEFLSNKEKDKDGFEEVYEKLPF